MTITTTLLSFGAFLFLLGLYVYKGASTTGDHNGLQLGWGLVQAGRGLAGLEVILRAVHAIDAHSAPVLGVAFALTLWCAGRIVGKPGPDPAAVTSGHGYAM